MITELQNAIKLHVSINQKLCQNNLDIYSCQLIRNIFLYLSLYLSLYNRSLNNTSQILAKRSRNDILNYEKNLLRIFIRKFSAKILYEGI